MKYQSGLINKDIISLQKKDWYNQRFDGCLNLIWMIAELEIRAEQRKTPAGNDRLHIGIFEDHQVDWYIDMLDIKRIAQMFLDRAVQENNIGQKTIKQWYADEQAFDQLIINFPLAGLSKLSHQAVSQLYNKLTSIYIKALSSSSLIDGLALGTDQIVQQEINQLLDKRDMVKDRGIIFSRLTAPVHQSFTNQAQLSLLNIAMRIKTLKSLSMKLQNPLINRLLIKHQQQYFWIRNNYHDCYVLSKNDFVKELRSLLASHLNIQQEINRLKNISQNNRRQKKNLLNKLSAPSYLRNILEISEEFTHWQDERKRRTMIFTHFTTALLEEIGRRFSYSLAEMRYLTRVEVKEVLAGRVFSRSELIARSQKMIIYQKGNQYEILTGPEADRMINKIFKNTAHSGVQDFRGLTAGLGQARGVVKIIRSVKEIGKVNPGDILVAVMTRPDYIVGLKKAAAIVTDEGGVTCHAAIIARELGIPCVIGTKIGTQVLQDGDLVEVNANHGWIRKIS